MTWYGTVSAWAAVAAGIAFALLAAAHFNAGFVSWLTILSAVLLLAGAFRTLRKMSGGLRLLCGAWGFAAAFLLTVSGTMTLMIVAPENAPGPVVAAFTIGAPLLALTGLALTVLHKETK
ncbi:MAG: hypothetical protein R3C27_10435 [Hyphomonadaceae bacterium]